MCTSDPKKSIAAKTTRAHQGCMRVKRVAGGAGDCGGLSAERRSGEANFLTPKSLKNKGKKFQTIQPLRSLRNPPQIFGSLARHRPKNHRHPPHPPQFGIPTPHLNHRCCGGPSHNHQSHFLGRAPTRTTAQASNIHPPEPCRTCTQRGGRWTKTMRTAPARRR